MQIEWDPEKNKAVKKKHGISFDDAKEVFQNSTNSLGGELISEQPDQFTIIGFSKSGKLVTVVYEFRINDDDSEFIWIVTLWKTTKEEKRKFNI
jgi:uncharacterized DUF497 family protein